MRTMLLLMALAISTMLAAQDAIIKTNGEEFRCKVEKVGGTEVEYRKADNPDGPLYTIARNEVFMIIYANGTRETITQLREVKQAPAKAPALVAVTPYDSLMRMSKKAKAWGIVGTVVGPVFMATGATMVGLAPMIIDEKERQLYNIIGGVYLGLGLVETILGPVLLVEAKKYRKQAEQVKSSAILELHATGLVVRF